MNDITKFQELLSQTLDIAKSQNNRIEGKKIKEIFSDMELSEEQLDQISMYLIANKIEVLGFIKPDELDLDNRDLKEGTEKESAAKGNEYVPKEINKRDSLYLNHYLDELKGIKEASKEEERNLILRIKQGDSDAKQRFIELYLHKVVEIAEEFRNQGLTAEDLIQEGNMALIQSVNMLPDEDDPDKVRLHVQECIRSYIFDAVTKQQNHDNFENEIMEKMNQIYDSLQELEDLLGRKATISELAKYMKVSEEEIQDALELAADILDFDNEEFHNHHEHDHDHEHEHNHEHDHDCHCHDHDYEE